MLVDPLRPRVREDQSSRGVTLERRLMTLERRLILRARLKDDPVAAQVADLLHPRL